MREKNSKTMLLIKISTSKIVGKLVTPKGNKIVNDMDMVFVIYTLLLNV